MKEQTQKRYLVSGSLCPTSFIKVKPHISLDVIGQHWVASEVAGRALEAAETASMAAERASEANGRLWLCTENWEGSEEAGKFLEGAGRASEVIAP